jgi:hypothetical protein
MNVSLNFIWIGLRNVLTLNTRDCTLCSRAATYFIVFPNIKAYSTSGLYYP